MNGNGTYFVSLGGAGGGGNGAADFIGTAVQATPGDPNTGGGGGACGNNATNAAGSGGSGVVILRIPSAYSATFSAGVTQTSATVGTDTVYTITAAGASDTVTFS